MKLATRAVSGLAATDAWQVGAPMWKVVPKRDEAGKPLSDFMMLAPGLKDFPALEIERVLGQIRGVLDKFPDLVVFANFNLALNLLWVSLRCKPGGLSMIVFALRARVPMLKLIGHQPMDGQS